jgi:hypothetical protein
MHHLTRTLKVSLIAMWPCPQVRSEVPGAAAVPPLAAGSGQPAPDSSSSSSSSSTLRSQGGRQPSAASSGAGGASAVDGSAGGDATAAAAAGAGSSNSSSQGAGPPAVSSLQQSIEMPAVLSQLGLGGSAGATVLQPLDYGFVTTAATISAREVAGGRDKRWERSWEHAMVRKWVGGSGRCVGPSCLAYGLCCPRLQALQWHATMQHPAERMPQHTAVIPTHPPTPPLPSPTLCCPRCATVPAGGGPTTWTSA